MTLEARYLAAFHGDWDKLSETLDNYFVEVEIEDFDPLEEDNYSTIAHLTTNYELEVSIEWEKTEFGYLVIFDVTAATDQIEIDALHGLVASPAEQFFDIFTLVYNSLGHKRHTQALSQVFSLESLLREFTIRVLLKQFGKEWWNEIKSVSLGLKTKTRSVEQSVDRLRQLDTENVMHEFYDFFNELYYLGFDDLRQIIQTQMKKSNDILFRQALQDIYGTDLVLGQLALLHTLRNHIMHGRYLSGENASSLTDAAKRIQRILDKQGYKSKSGIE